MEANSAAAQTASGTIMLFDDHSRAVFANTALNTAAMMTQNQFRYATSRMSEPRAPTLSQVTVSYTHLRAHETSVEISYAVFCLKKKK